MDLNNVKEKMVDITLTDGIPRKLKFTLNALAELEDAYGTVDDAFKKLDAGSIKAVRKVIWAGLMHDKTNPITEDQVGDLIDIAYMEQLMNDISKAMQANMPEEATKLPGPVEVVPNPN